MENLNKRSALCYLILGGVCALGQVPFVAAAQLIRGETGTIPLAIVTLNPSRLLLRRSFEDYLTFELTFDPTQPTPDYLNEKLAVLFPKHPRLNKLYFNDNQRFYVENHLKQVIDDLSGYYGKAGMHSFLLYHLIHDNTMHSKL